MDSIVVAVLIAVVVLSAFYKPFMRDLKHAKTSQAPEPTALDRFAEAVLDGIDAAVSKIFGIVSKIRSKK